MSGRSPHGNLDEAFKLALIVSLAVVALLMVVSFAAGIMVGRHP